MQKQKFLLFICSFSFSLLSSNFVCFAQDKIIAIVNSDIVTQKDLNDFINFTRVQMAAEYQGEQLESKIQSIKLDLLDRLIEDRLILQEAKRNKISIDENRVKAKIDEIKKRYGSEVEFRNTLLKQGFVQADIESKIKEQLLMYSIIDMKIKSKIVINPSEVTNYYEENIEKFKLSEQREFEAISITDENLAKEIVNNLKNGRNLQELTQEYSLSLNKLSARGDGELKKEIEEAVFKLNLGQVSEPVKIEDSYYIFKMNKIIPPRQPNISEVQDGIYAFLFEKRMQEEIIKWLDDLKKQSYIKIIQD